MHLIRYLCIAALLLTSIDSQSVADDTQWQKFSQTQPHMGSTVTIVVHAPDETTAKQAMKKGFARIEQLNAIFSDYVHDSECLTLSRQSPTKDPVTISQDMAELLNTSIHLSKASDGAFDVTVGPLTKLWRKFRRKKELPTDIILETALAATGYQRLHLERATKTVKLTVAGMKLDFGGIAKGYAADQALVAVQQNGCKAALVNAGGDIAIGDAPEGKRGWRIGVAPLKPKSPPSKILELKNCGVATSGDAWQFLEIDGERYSHILDPRTGWAVKKRCSVTVIAPTCTQADGLASAVTVLPSEMGLELVSEFDASCFVIENQDGKPNTYQSSTFPEK